jgi:hypothetical protein
LVRFSSTTAVMISRALDMAATSTRGANYVPRQVPTMSWNQTLPPLLI